MIFIVGLLLLSSQALNIECFHHNLPFISNTILSRSFFHEHKNGKEIHSSNVSAEGNNPIKDLAETEEVDAWESSLYVLQPDDVSRHLEDMEAPEAYARIISLLRSCDPETYPEGSKLLWEQIQLEATKKLESEPQAGPLLYEFILSQPSLASAATTIVCNKISSQLFPATSLASLFQLTLTPKDILSIHLDVVAATLRHPSPGSSALKSLLFNKGLHSLVCYRVSHRMWEQNRTGLAYALQSLSSTFYSADIHPAARIGLGIYLNAGKGVVIGETAVVKDDVSILQGVTLGGTGKERGDRHPKVGRGVVLYDGATVLGNIQVGDGAVITAKSIVTKPVPPLARVSGIPAKIKSYRNKIDYFEEEECTDW